MYCRRLTLLESIEEIRNLLYEVARNKLFTDNEVVAVSQKIDLLLNQYYELTGEKLAA